TLVCGVSALAMLGACADGGSVATGPEGEVEIQLAALNLGVLTHVAYTITVKDGSTVVSTATVDSNMYAVTGGDPTLVRYVAPCDAGGGADTVTVVVDSISVGGAPLAAAQ